VCEPAKIVPVRARSVHAAYSIRSASIGSTHAARRAGR
jgi:hypothetical protein